MSETKCCGSKEVIFLLAKEIKSEIEQASFAMECMERGIEWFSSWRGHFNCAMALRWKLHHLISLWSPRDLDKLKEIENEQHN